MTVEPRTNWPTTKMGRRLASCPGRLPLGGVYGGAWSKNRTLDPTVKRTGGYAPPDDVQRELMGIDWMTRHELNQAIPPTYTEHIGRSLLQELQVAA